MSESRITLQKVEGYIGGRENLRKSLQEDFVGHWMIREADLEACTYRHLRRFLEPDKRWRIFARAYSKRLGRYPDLTILEGRKPRLAIELKWRRKRISRKDRCALNDFLKLPHAKKAYFITTVITKHDYRKLGSDKTKSEKIRLKEIPLILDLPQMRLAKWEQVRSSYRQAL